MRTSRRRQRGQALVELALVVPIVMVLLLGTAQVGAILYGQITVDTAAREGARSASSNPDTSGAYSGGSAGTAVTCTGTTPTNPVCVAVQNAEGGLDGSAITTKLAPVGSGAVACASKPGHTGDGYVRVDVAYRVPIFVPFVDRLLATPGLNVRTITATVTTRIAPCGITDVTEVP
ncbi:MAG: pilus assembly protein [Candidatus Dormibacteraeota bacterium]|nr:pilus assembly protein [Candidatus Dormibacteraeota bacterium]